MYHWSGYPREEVGEAEGEEEGENPKGEGETEGERRLRRHKRSIRMRGEGIKENSFTKYLDLLPPVGEEDMEMPRMLEEGSLVEDLSSLPMLSYNNNNGNTSIKRRFKRQETGVASANNGGLNPITRVILFIAGGKGRDREKRFDLADLASGRWAGDLSESLPLSVQGGVVGVFHGRG